MKALEFRIVRELRGATVWRRLVAQVSNLRYTFRRTNIGKIGGLGFFILVWVAGQAGLAAELGRHTLDALEAPSVAMGRPAPNPGGFLRLAAAEVPSPDAAQPVAQPDWVWFEAEPAGGEDDDALSAGRMLWVGPGGSIQKTVVVPAPGTYQLWVRKFWNPQAIRWRVGGGESWQESRSQSLTDLVILGNEAGRRVGWFHAGSVQIEGGAQAFRLEVLAGDGNTTAYDCFLLTPGPFMPRGKLKPGEKLTIAQPGWFAFQPEADPFTESPIDLRYLNEREAGAQGYIRVQGESFVHERTGVPVRFWAVNAGMGVVRFERSEVDRYARGLAKRGVNLVRVHGPIYRGSGRGFGEIDTNLVDRLHEFVWALKREGIYTGLSIYFPLWVRLDSSQPQFAGYTGQHPFALLYFHAEFQRRYREWWRYLLTTRNPHTGLALKDDPAVAFAEMVNEDSTLFWTFDPHKGAQGNLPEAQRALLERQFGDWLRARYPDQTLAQIQTAAWGGTGSVQDDFAAGRVGFRSLWDMFNQRTRRDQDTARFLTELMQRFYRETYAYLKEELGYRGLVYGSNWKTASDRYLGPLDKYANLAGDFYDRHGYFGGIHTGPNAAWNLEVGQTYDDRSALDFRAADGTGVDFENPLFDLSYQGRPSTISEVNWPLPNRYRADMILVGAAYGSLQGSDALVWFAAGSPAWDGLPGKFALQTPVVLGQFPAAAVLYRQGLVRPGPVVVDLGLAVADLYALKGAPLPGLQNLDALRARDLPVGGTAPQASGIDPLAFLVGRCNASFVESGAAQSRLVDLAPYIDRDARRVTSHTGELEWHWGVGKVIVNAPGAQGATGFLRAAERIELADVAIESSLDYGAMLLVALDGQPIRRSAKLLLQVASEEQPYQWATEPAAGRRTIAHRGSPPVMVRELAGRVLLKRPDADSLTVTPLDANGYRQGRRWRGAGELTLEPDTLYYLFEK
ncbi:MAG: hypothetical protein FJ387_22875 [Verrucomicrobia bacterium]|nr:hypothetical protein [Verrucomicrobiota bacterium]